MKKKQKGKNYYKFPLFRQKAFTLVEVIAVVAIIGVLTTAIILSINGTNAKNRAITSQKKNDINSIADAYTAKSIDKHTYTPLSATDFENGFVPKSPDGTEYQGLLSENADEFKVCAPLEPKDKDINCFDSSNNEKCYCRSSKIANGKESAAPTPTASPIPLPTSPSCQQLAQLPAAQVSITDSFTRPNSTETLGSTETAQSWQTFTGTWGITNNTAYPVSISGPGSFPTNTYAVVDTGKSDGIVELNLARNIQDARVIFRAIDVNNNYFVERNGWGYHIEKTVNGQRYELTPRVFNASFSDGDKLKIEMRGPCVYFSLNNNLLLQINDITFTSGKHGFGTYFDKNMRFDNFTFRYP